MNSLRDQKLPLPGYELDYYIPNTNINTTSLKSFGCSLLCFTFSDVSKSFDPLWSPRSAFFRPWCSAFNPLIQGMASFRCLLPDVYAETQCRDPDTLTRHYKVLRLCQEHCQYVTWDEQSWNGYGIPKTLIQMESEQCHYPEVIERYFPCLVAKQSILGTSTLAQKSSIFVVKGTVCRGYPIDHVNVIEYRPFEPCRKRSLWLVLWVTYLS